jgi:hypothetical protein
MHYFSAPLLQGLSLDEKENLNESAFSVTRNFRQPSVGHLKNIKWDNSWVSFSTEKKPKPPLSTKTKFPKSTMTTTVSQGRLTGDSG